MSEREWVSLPVTPVASVTPESGKRRRPTQCLVCKHPQRDEIDQALVTGASVRDIEAQFGVNYRSVARHARNHLPQAMVTVVQKDEEARDLDVLEEVKRLYWATRSILDGAGNDKRLALAAIREVRTNLELLGRLLGQLDTSPKVNVLVSSQWVSMRGVILDALQDFPEARIAVAKRLEGLNNGGNLDS